MPSLLIYEGSYYSQLDERAFFSWLESISGVLKATGSPNGLVVSLRSSKLSESSIRNLLALHWRYRLPMGALASLLTKSNEHWFADPGAYWHEAVFGPQAVSPDVDGRLNHLHANGESRARAVRALCKEYQMHVHEAQRRVAVSKLWSSKAGSAPNQAKGRAKSAA